MEDFIQSLRDYRTANAKSRICLVTGNFNVIHPGHVRLLRFAKSMGDLVFAGVLPSSIQKELDIEKVCNMRALSMVDYACLLECSIEDAIFALRPDYVIKGKEHEFMHNPEEKALASIGGKLIFSSGLPLPSENDIIPDKNSGIEQTVHEPKNYLLRHGIDKKRICEVLDRFKDRQICVIGDLIVDEYITCDPLGMSQEDPTIVVMPVNSNLYIGGAAIVAAHAQSLGARTHFFSVAGKDRQTEFVEEKCRDYGVLTYLFEDVSRPTTLKQRFICKGKTMLRVSNLRQHGIDHRLSLAILEKLAPVLKNSELLIFSDFNYGCLPQHLVSQITELAVKYNVPIVADSQSSSQIGDVSRFKNTLLLTPTEREARLAVKDFESGLVVLAQKLIKKADSNNVIMTLGESGILVQNSAEKTDQLPALNNAAMDAAGAGDSLLVGASLALASGSGIWEAACIGSLAAAVQVSRKGNVPIKKNDILQTIRNWE